ncbi:putative transporter [Paramuribaculum intestinale]|jgi:AspT/YidE/YbjL antiporter-like protein|uniref:putative transporter n=1 Tax=Paramuribaculum intestinale TaxID=2094151 RepID=UPI000F46EABB|nr:putative transporter [Paramuribaculum intestinale]MBJ2185960.1 putative transporter [Muribaculaceae bacterium]MCX4330252.1 putative transporter [Paramuribaculum intestinale]ROT16741.1 putative transporter [Muribaculaceae bacterium Isolate-105 (HZI)]
MEWLESAILQHSALQAVIVLSLIVAVGLGLGKIKICGITLGVTWVFFAGILAGHVGLSIDHQMLLYAESFGLVLFVYELGLKVGPGFFSSFRTGGVKLNVLGLTLVMLGTLLAVAMTLGFSIPMADMVGIIAGATTNTPSLGAAQQALQQIGLSANGAALSCAVTYPLGVVGVILAIIVARKLFVRPSDMKRAVSEETNQTYIAAFQVHNPAVYGKTVREAAELINHHFVISRLWRSGHVSIPTSDTELMEGDRLLVITTEHDAPALTILFGAQEKTDWNADDIDWDAIDSSLISKHIIVTRPEINGKKLGSLRLRNSYGINISRVLRSGVTLLATPELVLQIGDRLTVVGEAKAVENVEKVLGNTATALRDPNMAAIFIGLTLGLLLGSVPIAIPGVSTPVKLGLAGGPIVVGIIISRFGPRFGLVTYTTRSANLMLRGIGLSLYLACLGLDAGAHFLDTIMRSDGLIWISAGLAITFLPTLLMAYVAVRWAKVDFPTACGMLCGAMANPMALDYSNSTMECDAPSVGYATAYPLAMFSRVVVAQLLVLLFCIS